MRGRKTSLRVLLTAEERTELERVRSRQCQGFRRL